VTNDKKRHKKTEKDIYKSKILFIKYLLQIVRKLAGDIRFPLPERQAHMQAMRMQSASSRKPGVFLPVQKVTDKRASDMRHMHSYLMRSSGHRHNADKAHFSARFEKFIFGKRIISVSTYFSLNNRAATAS